jgi:hypothetical protein
MPDIALVQFLNNRVNNLVGYITQCRRDGVKMYLFYEMRHSLINVHSAVTCDGIPVDINVSPSCGKRQWTFGLSSAIYSGKAIRVKTKVHDCSVKILGASSSDRLLMQEQSVRQNTGLMGCRETIAAQPYGERCRRVGRRGSPNP